MEDELKKTYKIFISHSPEDVDYVAQIAKLLIGMGLNNTQIFCTSLPGHGIPEDTDIFDYLMDQHSEYALHVIFVHSDNYYKSTISLNEMGVAWALRSEATSFLLPGVGIREMTGVVNSNIFSVKLYDNTNELKNELNQFFEKITNEFDVAKIDDFVWEEKRDFFVGEVQQLNENRLVNIELSYDATLLLDMLSDCEIGVLIRDYDYPKRKHIERTGVLLDVGYDPPENKRWNTALEELMKERLIWRAEKDYQLYRMARNGSNYWDKKWAEKVLFSTSYDEYVISLLEKYGKVPGDYFLDEALLQRNPSIVRTDEGLSIHHIDEDKVPGLSEISVSKIRAGAVDFNKAERLVYCHFVEHIILHMKIIEKELTKKPADRYPYVGLGIRGFVEMAYKYSTIFAGGRRKNDQFPEGESEKNRYSFSDRWITRFAKTIKYFVENIETRVDFQEWYGVKEDLDFLLSRVHLIYDLNPIDFRETISMGDFNGI